MSGLPGKSWVHCPQLFIMHAFCHPPLQAGMHCTASPQLCIFIAVTGQGSQTAPFLQVEMSTRSTNRSFKKLISVNDIPAEEIYKTLCAQTVDLVFTAHPTQVHAGTCGAMESGAVHAVHGQRSSPNLLASPVMQLGLCSKGPQKPCRHPIWAVLQSTPCRENASCFTDASLWVRPNYGLPL